MTDARCKEPKYNGDWAMGWALLWVAGLLGMQSSEALVARGAGSSISSVAMLFLVRGAFAFARMTAPAWLVPAVIGIATLRAGLWWSGSPETTWLLGWLCEAPLAAWAAVVVLRMKDRDEVGINERILPWAFFALAAPASR